MDVRRGAFQAQGPVKRTKLVPFGQNGSPVWRPLGVSGARVKGLRSEQEPEVMCTNESGVQEREQALGWNSVA